MHIDKLDCGQFARRSPTGNPADDFETDLPNHQLQLTQVATSVGDLPSDPIVKHFTYPAGSRPLSRYTIRQGLGVGGFGEVYFAVSDAGKEVALKRIQRNLDIELRGASHCLNIKHPNLVSLHDICQSGGTSVGTLNQPSAGGQAKANSGGDASADGPAANPGDDQAAGHPLVDPDQWWVVMEYIAGPNLRQVLDNAPEGLSVDQTMRWFRGMAAGIGHLHDAGLVHRDVKPGNVFDDRGIIKVGDYGLSKFISTSHRGGHTESVGTFHYMAPEIGRGHYGRQIDIYALGIVLHEMLTGRVPFDGESCHEIIIKHLTALPDLSVIQSPYRETIARCLDKDPRRRFASVGEMLRSLEPVTNPTVAGETFAHQPVHVATAGDILGNYKHRAAHNAAKADAGWPRANPIYTENPAKAPEPVARAVRGMYSNLRQWWNAPSRRTGSKAFLILVAVCVTAVNLHWLLPLVIVLGTMISIVYVPYYIVCKLLLHVSHQPSYAQAQAVAGLGQNTRQPSFASGFRARRIDRKQWRQRVRASTLAKPFVQRLAELFTSLIAAIITLGVLGVAAGLFELSAHPVNALTIAPLVWVGVVVCFASFGLLSVGKFWEAREGGGGNRRLVMAVLGAGVGMVAYRTSDFLQLPLGGPSVRPDINPYYLHRSLYDSLGQPTLLAVMAHFACFFALLRWWRPIDPLRRKRLSVWSVIVAVVAQWFVDQFLPMPQPAGMLVAGGVAVVAQISAQWIKFPSPEALHADLAGRQAAGVPEVAGKTRRSGRQTSSPGAGAALDRDGFPQVSERDLQQDFGHTLQRGLM